jgi:hypothetical protein
MLKNRFTMLRFGSPDFQPGRKTLLSFRPQGLTSTMTVEKPASPTGNGNRFGLGFQTYRDVFRLASFPRFLSFGFLRNASFDLCYRQIYTPSAVKAMQSAA